MGRRTRPVAFHLVWGCYGFWPPNDPRGSWSRYVGSRRLYAIGGPARTVSPADRSHMTRTMYCFAAGSGRRCARRP